MMTYRSAISIYPMELAMRDVGLGDLLAHIFAACDAHSTELNAMRTWFLDLGYIHTWT